MEDNILSDVIALEKTIQARIAAETSDAEKWVAAAKEQIRKDLALRQEGLRGEARQSVQKAKEEAEAKASELIRRAEEEAGLLLGVSDERLKEMILERLSLIIPEKER